MNFQEEGQTPSSQQIDALTAKQMMSNEEITIVDIRDEQSFASSHIEGAVSLTQQNVEGFLQSADKNRPVICYCYHGFSSQNVAEYFASCGIKKVYSLIGGFEAWQMAGDSK